jgi:uncharacterized protein
MAVWRLAFLALFFGGVFGAASAQAIDCASNALNHSEHAVCASEPLRELAASIDKRYPRVADGLGVKQSQLDWIRIRDRCNGNLACLTTAYRERNAYLAKLPVTAKPPATTTAFATPIKHLFLRHAPAQLLNPSAVVASAPPMETSSPSERLERAAGPSPATHPTTQWNTLWFLGGVLFASILLWQMLTNVCGKCPSCHHWFARVEIDRRQLAGEASELAARRRLGLRSRATASPLAGTDASRGRLATVRHYNQCRICLHEWETVTQEAK